MKYNDTTWFLDYVGINHSCKYNGWIPDDHKDFKLWTTNFIEEFNDKHFPALTNNGIQPIFIIFYKNYIRFEFKGSFFKSDNIKDDLTHLDNFYKKLHHEFFIKPNMFNLSINHTRPTVFRIDVSANVPKIKLNKVDFTGKYNKGFTCRSYYMDKRKKYNKLITGWDVGTRGRTSSLLRIYLKNYDPNKAHDVMRFGTTDFTRIEYEIGSEFVKKHGFKWTDELFAWNPEKWKSLLQKEHDKKNYIISERKIKFKHNYEDTFYKNFEYPPDSKYYGYETCKGIINNKLSDQETKQLNLYIQTILHIQ